MFSGCLQDFSRIFSGCSDGSCGPGGIWWSFQMKVWTLMTQRNSMIPSYSMIPAILWSQLFYDSQLFDDPKLFDDPQLFDDQLEVWTLIIQKSTVIPSSPMVLLEWLSWTAWNKFATKHLSISIWVNIFTSQSQTIQRLWRVSSSVRIGKNIFSHSKFILAG